MTPGKHRKNPTTTLENHRKALEITTETLERKHLYIENKTTTTTKTNKTQQNTTKMVPKTLEKKKNAETSCPEAKHLSHLETFRGPALGTQLCEVVPRKSEGRQGGREKSFFFFWRGGVGTVCLKR